jgi:L-ascorbate 6-phosphate lactonase
MTKMLQEMALQVPAGAVRLWWLGQAGFAFKTPDGHVFYVDPYLSDACEPLHGFVRLSLAPVAAQDVVADWMIFTHEHTDHLDPDAVPVIARNNPECRFAGPAACKPVLAEAGIAARRQVILKPNQAHDLGPVTVHTAMADHGDLSPDALSLLLDFAGVRVLVAGDTSWRPKLIAGLCEMSPDVVLPPINGSFGNMNHLDAARLVQQASPRMAIPCHFWTFAEHGPGDPGGFVNACRGLCPKTKVLLIKPGSGIIIRAAKSRAGKPKRGAR